MGVRGLHAFAQAYQSAVSQQREFPVTHPSHEGVTATTLAVDGWAWLYDAWIQHFGESVQGGNYHDLFAFTIDTVHAWRLANLEPVFFWDGPIPLLKLDTALSRRTFVASKNSSFMRSSAASRASRSFQAECYPRLPLASHTIKAALRSQGVQNVVTQGEADGAVAELAEENHGIAVSKDSDYFILCARGEGRARYAPLDSFEYLVEIIPAAGEQPLIQEPEDHDGFEAVQNRRKRRGGNANPATQLQTAVTVLDRPPAREMLGSQYNLKAVRMRAYSSHAIAAALRIPPPLLPLLGSVIGNDYSLAKQEDLLFRHLQSWTDRIREASEVVHHEWRRSIGLSKDRSRQSTASPARKTLLKAALTSQIDDDAFSDASSATATPVGAGRAPSLSELDSATVMDPVRALVVSTVNSLVKRSDQATHRIRFIEDADKEACVQSIIDSIAAYSLLTHDTQALSALNPSNTFFSPSVPDENAHTVMQAWRAAFDSLSFSPDLVSVLTSRSFILTLAPEDPDLKSTQVGPARQLRRWMYAVLFGVYGMEWARDTIELPAIVHNSPESTDEASLPKPKYGPGEKPDDIISVDTESTNSSDAVEPASRPSSALDYRDDAPPVIKPPPAITEYIRKGDRLVAELVPITSLPNLLEEKADKLPASLRSLLGQYEAALPTKGGALDAQADPLPLPAPLLPLQTRLDIYRYALSADDESMDTIPLHLLPLAASVRHLIASIAEDAGESKKRLNWTRAEVTSAVRAGCQTSRAYQDTGATSLLSREQWVSLPSMRGIHLESTLQITLDAAHDLACSLLLFPDHLPEPHTLFDGPLLQLLLDQEGHATEATHLTPAVKEEANALVKLILTGHEDDLALDPAELKRLRKENKKRNRTAANGAPQRQHASAPSSSAASSNLFAMLQGHTT